MGLYIYCYESLQVFLFLINRYASICVGKLLIYSDLFDDLFPPVKVVSTGWSVCIEQMVC